MLSKSSSKQRPEHPPQLYRRHLTNLRKRIRDGERYFDQGYDWYSGKRLMQFELNCWREVLVRQYAWAIPSRRALGTLYYHEPIVEVGSGLGYWAHCLRTMGARVRAFDLYADERRAWTDVEVGGPEVLSSFSSHTLFLCWPPYDEPMARECIEYYSGKRLLYVGERNGCTGDRRFEQVLNREFRCIERTEIPSFPHLHDDLYVFERQS